MFGFGKRAKAKAASLQVVQQVLSVATMFRSPGPEFWREPYVLGALYGLIISTSRYAIGGTLDPATQGEIVMQVLSETTGQDGVVLGRLGVSLMQSKDVEFVLAVQRAASISGMLTSQSITEMSPEVELAIKRAREMKGTALSLGHVTSEVGAVIEELYMMWLIEPLRERLPDAST